MTDARPSTTIPDASLLRAGAASIWLLTGLLVLTPGYRAVGVEQLARASAALGVGLPPLLMWLCCAAEVVLGLLVLRAPRRPLEATAVAGVQAALVVTFTLILAVTDPMNLAHPYGILTKNVPLLGVVACSWLLERDGRWTDRALWTLRAGAAVIWMTEGLIPKVLFQQADELEVVRGSHLVPIDASVFLAGLGLAQAASGVLALVLRGRPLLALLGCHLAALVVLPLLVSWQHPDLWVHPFGPMTKNVPIIAGTLVALRELHRRHVAAARHATTGAAGPAGATDAPASASGAAA